LDDVEVKAVAARIFQGAKQSGFGAERGQEGLEEFTQVRIINMAK
jgi:acyl-CoA reductase-like NAD-dependent aldehyde dehydrogenase